MPSHQSRRSSIVLVACATAGLLLLNARSLSFQTPASAPDASTNRRAALTAALAPLAAAAAGGAAPAFAAEFTPPEGLTKVPKVRNWDGATEYNDQQRRVSFILGPEQKNYIHDKAVQVTEWNLGGPPGIHIQKMTPHELEYHSDKQHVAASNIFHFGSLVLAMPGRMDDIYVWVRTYKNGDKTAMAIAQCDFQDYQKEKGNIEKMLASVAV
eukprot:CAMPEP_0203861982 /NCGR_PEP_ID=MMETSP0359-20131031/13329_1 /ASSEMBLY_ACC=CAM_ASM_000338 /TAXON_ID=268821 /ORGANISM="Scrippsiella Hangoei, Strain SHTV-5" /LENGTH=211 /DNA_ID=CAMNT_0050779311 /DNA_START=53 /DNA_END=688 /DNA_ORIENTATION=+